MPKKRKPSYLLHQRSGQARVRIDGKDHYLGEFDSPESRDRYDELIREWTLAQDVSAITLTVDELCLRFMDHAESYYVKNGKPTSEVNNFRIALRPLIKLFEADRARDFSPRKLLAVREAMIEAGCVRTSINRQVGRIKRLFRWATENEYVPPCVITGLDAVSGLRAGRSGAVESEPVKPVPEQFVDAVRPHVTRQVWGMIQVQKYTGMRPGEVIQIRGCDLNTSGKVWEYRPSSHKTEHHGKERIIFIGSKAQAVLKEFLKHDLQAYLFSPRDARSEFNEIRKKNRKTPMTPSQRKRKRKAKPKKQPADKYTTASYGQAIRKACIKAEIPKWSPNQLRHTRLTETRREFGLAAARVEGGHSSVNTTEIYAERDLQLAMMVAEKTG